MTRAGRDTTREILIVRHGRCAHPPPPAGGRLSAREFRAWIDAYNRATIDAASVPPPALCALAADIPCIVCSDLPRAIASAKCLCAPTRPPRVSALFREAGRPLPGDWPVRLPLHVWDRISVLLWRRDWMPSDERIPAARARAAEAARELTRLADEFGRVLYVGHGTFNAMVGDGLRRCGWKGPRRTGDQHWGASRFRRIGV